MAVTVAVNGARRFRREGGKPLLLVDVSVGTSHQVIPFDEDQLLALKTTDAMVTYIANAALGVCTQGVCITDLPPGLPDFRGTSLLTGTPPMASTTVATRSVTTSPTLTTADYTVWVDATSGALVATLPTAVGNGGQRFEIKKTDSTANTVTVTPAGSEKIDGNLSTVVLSLQGATCVITSNGVGWIQTGGTRASVGASAAGIAGIADSATKAALTAIQSALAAQGVVTSPA